MKGSKIILASNPRGMFLEGIVSGTPSPGTCMTIVPATAPVLGRFTWQVAQMSADGDPRMIAVLVEDDLQGFTYTTAYTNGARCKLYVPYAGEDMNMIFAGEPGTGNANVHAIGDRMIVQHNTGLLIVTSTSSVQAPFICNEATTIAADTTGLVWCTFAG